MKSYGRQPRGTLSLIVQAVEILQSFIKGIIIHDANIYFNFLLLETDFAALLCILWLDATFVFYQWNL